MAAANSGSVGRGKAFQPKVSNSGMDSVQVSLAEPFMPISILPSKTTRAFSRGFGFASALPERWLGQGVHRQL